NRITGFAVQSLANSIFASSPIEYRMSNALTSPPVAAGSITTRCHHQLPGRGRVKLQFSKQQPLDEGAHQDRGTTSPSVPAGPYPFGGGQNSRALWRPWR